MATVVGIVLTDLLKGIAIGMVVSIFYILRNNYRNPYEFHKAKLNGKDTYKIILSEEVSFLNKGSILQTINQIPARSQVVIDASKSKVIDHDVIEIIKDFTINAASRDVGVTIVNIPEIDPSHNANKNHDVAEKELAYNSKNETQL
jgi:SulP family sulfate permease